VTDNTSAEEQPPTSLTQVALDALTKAPVPDRVNAKLAAKQFEALVKQFSDGDLSRNSSPGSRASRLLSSGGGGGGSESSPDGGDLPPSPCSPGPSRLKRMMSFRRNPTMSMEKSYTESVWLSEQQSESAVEGGSTVSPNNTSASSGNSSKRSDSR
jgi:hypothetical protein